MTDDERAALVERIAQMRFDAISGLDPEWNEVDDAACPGFRDTFRDEARAILAAIEPAIRADERARVVAEATTDEVVERAVQAYWGDNMTRAAHWYEHSMEAKRIRAAIRAALGVEL